MVRGTLFIILLVIHCSTIAFSKEIVFPQGPERALDAADFFRHTNGDTNYDEIWRYSFVFEGGAKVFLSYSLISIPFLGTNCGINISFYNFRGNNYEVGREYSEESYREHKGTNAGIHIVTGSDNNIFFMDGLPEDDHHVVFKTTKNHGYVVDLTFSNIVPGKVVGDGLFQIGQNEMGLYVHIPHGRVTGTIGVGKDLIEVEGYGYMEHLRYTKRPLDMATYSLQLYGNYAPYAGTIFVGSEDFGFTPYGYVFDKNSRNILIPRTIESRKKKAAHDSVSFDEIHITWLNSTAQ